MEFNRIRPEPAEQGLVDALESGAVYGPEAGDRDAWPIIRAQTIRNLLRGVYPDVAPDPKGLLLRHVRIDGRIDLDDVDTDIRLSVVNCDMPGGLSARRARIPDLQILGMSLNRSAAREAVLELDGLHASVLRITGTTIINTNGPALSARRLTVDSDVYLDGGFCATANDYFGAVQLSGSTIGGDLHMNHAELTNRLGPALAADKISVGSDVFFLDTQFKGDSDVGVLLLGKATVEGRLFFDDKCSYATFGERDPTVTLTGTDVRGELTIGSALREIKSDSTRWNIDGVTYRTVTVGTDDWLGFLRDSTSHYSTQPYQQFAAVARARGDEKLTRKILIAQHDDLIARSREDDGLLTGRQRTWQRVVKYTVGYGYRTWRALAWLFLVVGLAMVTSFTFGSSDWLWGWGWDWAASALHQPEESKAGAPGDPCRPVDLVVLGLETIPLIPLITGGADRCFVTNSLAGTTFLGISVGLKLAAWALAALFVAGYTNIVRNPGP